MSGYKYKFDGTDRGRLFVAALMFSCLAFILFNFYALYFIGSAIYKMEFYDLAAAPCLPVISYCWRELHKIYSEILAKYSY